MILSAHQPNYLPWLGLFEKLDRCEVFVFFNRVQYVGKEWVNRNRIKGPNGVFWLTVPVSHSQGSRIPIAEVRIDNSKSWQVKHWKALRSCYQRSPFFDEITDLLSPILLSTRWELLTDLNQALIAEIARYLNIQTQLIDARDFSWRGEKSELVLNMCLDLGATQYIFGEQGLSYADVNEFRKKEVVPYFQQYRHPVYPQLWGDFVSHLSIVDLLFNVGTDAVDVLRGER